MLVDSRRNLYDINKKKKIHPCRFETLNKLVFIQQLLFSYVDTIDYVEGPG